MTLFKKPKPTTEYALASAGNQIISEEIIKLAGSTRVVNKAVCIPSIVGEGALRSVAAMDDKRFAVGTAKGNILVIAHGKDAGLSKGKQFKAHEYPVTCITVHGGISITASSDNTAKVWIIRRHRGLKVLHHPSPVVSVAANGYYITACCNNGKVYIYKNAEDFAPFGVYSGLTGKILSASLLDRLHLMAACQSGSISYISLLSRSFVSRQIIVKDMDLYDAAVLNNGNIVKGGGDYPSKGYASILSVSIYVKGVVEKYAQAVYGKDFIAEMSALMKAYDDVHDAKTQMSLLDACKLITGIKVSHRNIITKVFKEAEESGLVASGGVERFLESTEIRHEMGREHSMLKNEIWSLFVRQAETDERLHSIENQKRVQQATTMITALLVCIPFVGKARLQVAPLVMAFMEGGSQFIPLAATRPVENL